ncbi:hypothetical protein J4Q44_G00054790 [Coregonus suidteri]|uniref:tRNA (uracil-O(2)-)-methyltransferase n=1 Tax=Coregonus suidteri TaxID=861788 RepID=A0AAN8MFR2_9TELE
MKGETFQGSLGLHLLRPDDWFSDKVAYPKLPWLGGELLPKLVCWATEGKTSEYRSTLSLLPVEKYSIMYQQLKDKYKEMVKVLWGEERAEKGLTVKQSFVDLGCGNGLLVHILSNEGHPGKGIDVRKRKIWNMYGPQTHLEVRKGYMKHCFRGRLPENPLHKAGSLSGSKVAELLEQETLWRSVDPAQEQPPGLQSGRRYGPYPELLGTDPETQRAARYQG